MPCLRSCKAFCLGKFKHHHNLETQFGINFLDTSQEFLVEAKTPSVLHLKRHMVQRIVSAFAVGPAASGTLSRPDCVLIVMCDRYM